MLPARRLLVKSPSTAVEPPFRHSGAGGNPVFGVTPVKTGVHPHPRNLDTVFQRYDGPIIQESPHVSHHR